MLSPIPQPRLGDHARTVPNRWLLLLREYSPIALIDLELRLSVVPTISSVREVYRV